MANDYSPTGDGTLTEGGISYRDDHHDIVVELAQRGIMSSICSKNDAARVLPYLRSRGIADYFIFPSINWEPKGPRLAAIVEDVQLRAGTVMFIDDNPSNRAEAAAMAPGLQVEDETFIARLLDDPRFLGKADRGMTRLAQYKLLETRKKDEAHAPGGNEAFLRGCDIRTRIEYDIAGDIDRVIELINRTNQLNFTKRRLPEDIDQARAIIEAAIRDPFSQCGLVQVIDKCAAKIFVIPSGKSGGNDGSVADVLGCGGYCDFCRQDFSRGRGPNFEIRNQENEF